MTGHTNLEIGSPPRMWGTPNSGHDVKLSNRFTPTHVGNTMSPAWAAASMAVHPHACGEHYLAAVIEDGDYRFTPTHVGNT